MESPCHKGTDLAPTYSLEQKVCAACKRPLDPVVMYYQCPGCDNKYNEDGTLYVPVEAQPVKKAPPTPPTPPRAPEPESHGSERRERR